MVWCCCGLLPVQISADHLSRTHNNLNKSAGIIKEHLTIKFSQTSQINSIIIIDKYFLFDVPKEKKKCICKFFGAQSRPYGYVK